MDFNQTNSIHWALIYQNDKEILIQPCDCIGLFLPDVIQQNVSELSLGHDGLVGHHRGTDHQLTDGQSP